MKKKSVVFIETTGNRTNVFDNYMRLPLMGSLYLGTILHNQGYDVRIFNENILGREIDPFEIQADVFCITALTISANRAKLLASQFKKIYPDSKVIVGGIHASLLPEEFTDVADHVVLGEAEEIIVDIIENKFDDKIINGSRIADLEKLPVVNYGLLEDVETLYIMPIMTSRGCPFDCSFCTVTKIFGRKFRMQSAKRIVEEIENAIGFFNKNEFFFYDDNFTADKARIHELCDIIIAKKLDIIWGAQVRADLAKDSELVKKMTKAGLKGLYIGFESIDDEILKALHKSQTRSDIESAIKQFHEYGVHIHGMFIFGEDHDTVENISNTVDFAIKNEIDTVQFMILTPFPGTQCYEQLEKENRLFHKDWDYYNGMFAVFQTKKISPAKLTKETYRAYRKFYSLRRTLLDSLSMAFNVFINALVWNFKEANRYNIKNLFLRVGAKTLVVKYSDIYNSYLKYLRDIERRAVLKTGVRKFQDYSKSDSL
ncbi:MAG: radical SAM protein [Candidatus Theseobacter exili]|nr:radical SAM protein [Candidatus Theseobacter exili]